MNSLEVTSGPPGTSLQDLGRFGHLRSGVSRSGAMDKQALQLANLLVGNRPGEAAIELTLMRAAFRFCGNRESRIAAAVVGAHSTVTLNGKKVASSTIATGLRAFLLSPEDELSVAATGSGVYRYLAVSGGFAVPSQLGSRSTQRRAGLGSDLTPGDRLPLNPCSSPLSFSLSAESLAQHFGEGLSAGGPKGSTDLSFVPGPQLDHFSTKGVATFLDSEYRLSTHSDRMGIRLEGPTIELVGDGNIISDAVTPGCIQVPASGRPLVLMADGPPTGGYPKIGCVVTGDLGRLAQLRPGDRVRFSPTTLTEAHARLARERSAFARLIEEMKPIERRASGPPR